MAGIRQPTTGRVDGLDSLRLILALVVVAFHYLHAFPTNTAPDDLGLTPGPRILIFGRYAVEAFFIISGMVIARSARHRAFGEYAINRFVRLWPAMAVCATITVIATQLIDSPGLPYANKLQYAGSMLTLPLLVSDYFGVDWSYWSLTYELRFYLLAGLFFAFFRSTSAILVGMTVWMALTLVALIVHNPLLETLTISKASACFIVGILIYLYESERHRRPVILLLAVGAIALIPMQMMADVARGQAPNPIYWPEAIATTIVIVGIVLAFNAVKSFGPMRGIARMSGAMSYPLYLVHQLAGYVIIAQLIWAGVPPLAAVVLAVVGVLGIAYGVAAFVEPWLARRTKMVLTTGLALLTGSRAKAVPAK